MTVLYASRNTLHLVSDEYFVHSIFVNISHTFIHLLITGPKLLLDFLSFFTHRCCIHTCGEQAHA
jgi:hypothetical protein